MRPVSARVRSGQRAALRCGRTGAIVGGRLCRAGREIRAGITVTRKAVLLHCATPLALCLGMPAWVHDATPTPQGTPTPTPQAAPTPAPAPEVPAAHLRARRAA